MLEPVFHELVLEDQDVFASEEGWKALLQLIPDNDVRNNLEEKWELNPGRSSENKWEDFMDEIEKDKKGWPVRLVLPVSCRSVVHAASRA